jgi:hypothetical protein
LIVGLLAAFLLSVPPQTREIYRIMAEDWVAGDLWLDLKVGLTFLSLLLATFGMWVATNDIGLRRQSLLPSEKNESFEHHVLVMVLLLPALLVPLGLAVGLWWTVSELTTFPEDVLSKLPELNSIVTNHQKSIHILHGAFAVALAVAGAALWTQFAPLRPVRTIISWTPAFHSKARVRSLVAISGVIAAFIVLVPFEFPQFVGTTFIALSFVMILAMITSALTDFFDNFRIPIITMLLLFAVGLSISGLNDNHVIEPVKRAAPFPILESISGSFDIEDAAFTKWLGERGDRDHFKDKPYPVFIVTAAGGGLFAAAHAAAVLARFQDRCPSFAQHVFAISGVSGGSLGAAAFAGLVRDADRNRSWQACKFGDLEDSDRVLEKKTRAFLKNDFLAPLVGRMLFADFPQRFIPYPFQALDRAQALQVSFERAWERVIPAEPSKSAFKALFLDIWDPKGAAPALLLNMTDVDNGLRVVASPFSLQQLFIDSYMPDASKYTSLMNFYSYSGWFDGAHILFDMKLSTAVGLSSRFPWILPAGTFYRATALNEPPKPEGASEERHKEYKLRLVDGGYFENSGAATAMDVISHLTRYFVLTNEKESSCRIHEKFYEAARSVLDNKAATYQEENDARVALNRLPEICQNFLGSKRILAAVGVPKGVTVYLISIDLHPIFVTKPWFGGSEILVPLLGLMSTREMRGQLESFRASTALVPCWDELGKWTECNPRLVQLNRLDSRYYLLPLGWQISSNTFDFIAFHSGRAAHGGVPDKPPLLNVDYNTHLEASDTAACAVQLILHGEIDADWKARARPCARPPR